MKTACRVFTLPLIRISHNNLARLLLRLTLSRKDGQHPIPNPVEKPSAPCFGAVAYSRAILNGERKGNPKSFPFLLKTYDQKPTTLSSSEAVRSSY